MSEFITLQVGQCGNQIGSVFWPLLLHEHGILGNDPNRKGNHVIEEAMHCFFHNPRNITCHSVPNMVDAKVKARALLIDMEESVVDRYQTGELKGLFDKACTLSNHPGSGNNWAVGHYTHGSEQRSKLEEMVRVAAEQCDSLNGFLLLYSLGGGTGSGLGTAALACLDHHYPKIDRIVTCIHPGGFNDVVTSPYNIALSLHKMIDYATCVLPIDNKALFDIVDRHFREKKSEKKIPYKNINSIIARMLLHLTCGSRFPGMFNFNISELSTSLVPFPKLHFLSTSMSPLNGSVRDVAIIPKDRDLINAVSSRENHLQRIDHLKGKIFAASILARGDSSLTSFEEYVNRLTERWKMMCWAGVKVAHCSVPAINTPRSLLLLTNSSSMQSLFSETLNHFNRLFRKKAHVHHYTNVEGFTQDQFEQTQEALRNMIHQYNLHTKEVNIPRLHQLKESA